jgi:hypothetical protein
MPTRSRYYVCFAVAILAWLSGVSTILANDRMTDSDGERFMWGGEKIQPPTIALDNPEVIGIVPESTHVNLSPEALEKKPGSKFLAKTTINIITKDVLKESDIDSIAAEVRKQASLFHVVGVRFKQQQSTGGHYGWFLYWDGKETVRDILASKEKLSTAAGAAASGLFTDEKLIGTWADANAFPGTFSITSRGNRLWLSESFTDGSGGDSRTRLRTNANGLLVGVYEVNDLGTFQKDGTDTDAISVRVVGDKLHVFDNSSGGKAWFVGSPSTQIDLQAIALNEPHVGNGGYAKTGFGSINVAFACIRAAEAKLPTTQATGAAFQKAAAKRDVALRAAYRTCFAKNDIEKLGTLSQWAAEGHISCGSSRKDAFQTTDEAKAVMWAALIADETGHINARTKFRGSTVVRGSPEAVPFCNSLIDRFGPSGTEAAGLFQP